MTYVVTDNCIKCKYMDCIEVCPVDCFYEGENMLVIHPDECIDCGVCEPECPADAIKPDTEPGLDKWLQVNTEYAEKWPNITAKKEPPADAKSFDGECRQIREILLGGARRRRLSSPFGEPRDDASRNRRIASPAACDRLTPGHVRACSKYLDSSDFLCYDWRHAGDTTSIYGAEALIDNH